LSRRGFRVVLSGSPESNELDYVARLAASMSPSPLNFAGKLDYPKYSFWDRKIIQMIMWMTKGPTDPAAVVEFTNWEQVEAFGKRICEI